MRSSSDTRSVASSGFYHMFCYKVTFDLGKKFKNGELGSSCITLHLVTLATGEGLSPIGSLYRHRINVTRRGGDEATENMKKMIHIAAIRAGIIIKKEGKLINAETGEANYTQREFAKVEGKQLVVKITENKKAENPRYRFQCSGSEFWLATSPEVSKLNVVLDPYSIAKIGGAA